MKNNKNNKAMNKNAKIYVSGHRGMVGNAVVGLLQKNGYGNLIVRDSGRLDLRDQDKVEKFVATQKPDYIFHLAAKVGGIKANIASPAEFLYDNLMIEANVINAAYRHKIKKLLFLGSSCVYPRNSPQPMEEKYLLSNTLEPTNEGYALAKIAGLKLCEYYNTQYGTNFISLMPANLYGPHDNFDRQTSHVAAALMRKCIEAKAKDLPSVEAWGTGNARRELLYVDDLASACVYFMNNYDSKDLPAFINIGYGSDVTVKELAEIIRKQAGYEGVISWNAAMPDGMPQKLLATGLAKRFGWEAATSLEEGIRRTIEWYVKNKKRYAK